MKKVLFFAVALCLVASSAAMGADMTKRIGLGFVTTSAPVGGRYWVSERIGIDLGFGLDKTEFDIGGGEKESFTDWTVLGALPIKIHSVGDNRVNFNFLPLVQYTSIDNGEGENSDNEIDLFFGLEFEAFVTEAFSVGASHGVVVVLYSPGADGAESTTDIHLTGDNLTQFGFHYYLPGGE